ncbi:Rieske (2Fe-2S) protein [Bradyrhizobium prioriisuperbiae]|uniref:Rieske (2Fe-2S) protein n=1 Tax=Bradyrhizobium prioriisuperbiae TaxID=2854389 RepID=UPI0028EA2A71|nr:Rieske (2Fe-2S) protein [Bradyrhizobium prioritasuperba]
MADEWIAICESERLVERSIIPARVDGIELIVLRDASEIYAFERACPHEQADLCRGDVRDGRLFCPRHRASFDLRDGQISPGWPSRDLRRYPVRIADGQVWVYVKAMSFDKAP